MAEKVSNPALFKLSYGLFIISVRDGQRDTGCVINTVIQVADNPKMIVAAVNKANYTHKVLMETGEFNVSVLSESVPFAVFENFGFRSGAEADKFEGVPVRRSANGICYLTEHTNAYISGKVVSAADCGSHTVFVAEVTEADVLSDENSVTYEYYSKNIKPKPQQKKKGYVCKICGYVYEGDELPEDFVCPWCKHGAEDFEPIA